MLVFAVALIGSIPKESLTCSGQADVSFWGLCSGAGPHELFLADYLNSVVRVLHLLNGRLDLREAYRCTEPETVRDVAYSADLDTLFVATLQEDNSGLSVRSFVRVNSEWNFRHRMQLSPEGNGWVFLRVLGNGGLFCGLSNTDCVAVCSVQVDRSMQYSGRIKLPEKHLGFDAQLTGNEERLASYNRSCSYLPAKRNDCCAAVARRDSRRSDPPFLWRYSSCRTRI